MDADSDEPMSQPALRNGLLELMRAGRVGLCLRTTLASTNDIAFLAAAAGFDALYVDLEHSTATPSDAAQVCSTAGALGVTPLVRLTSVDDTAAVPLLDEGCQGVIAPHVRSAAEARRLVARCAYAPLGQRSSVGRARRLGYRHVPAAQAASLLNAATLLCVMVEDEQGIDAVDEIAAVDGIGLVLVGTQDLTNALGIPGQVAHPRVRSLYERVAAGCDSAGTAFGIAGVAEEDAIAMYVAMGARFVSAGTDTDLLRTAATARVRQLRAVTGRPVA